MRGVEYRIISGSIWLEDRKILDAIFSFLSNAGDLGIMWLAAAPNCPLCGGEGIRPVKQPSGKQRWHCKECCHEWISSRLEVIRGRDSSGFEKPWDDAH